MRVLMSLLAVVAITGVAAKVGHAPVNFRGSGQIQSSQIKEALQREMSFTDKDLADYEEGLRDMFVSLPKNRHGNLGHDSVRIALHRFFVHRHGWWLRGLFLTASPDNETTVEEKDRVPDLLQEAFERSTSEKGASLHDLAAMAASVEDLVAKETAAHLRDAYAATEMSLEGTLHRDRVHDVVHTYFLSFLLEHNWTVDGPDDLLWKREIIAEKYPMYSKAAEWLAKVFDEQVKATHDAKMDFNATLNVATRIGERFHELNDRECSDLTETLQKMESRKPGRVRLSVFYNMSVHSHWDFNEKVEMLRDLGALDDSDPSAKYVIITNYAMSRPNCVNTSNVYEVCCPDRCENIMRHLESSIGSSHASVQTITAFIASLAATSSGSTPHELSEVLLSRLQEVADRHGGEVPLHGRLFAQWLHHVFPLVCPFPHESGTVNPASWVGSDRDRASESEMKEHIEADTCTVNWEGKIDCGEESSELPWNTAEELLSSAPRPKALQGVRSQFLFIIGLALFALAAVAHVAMSKHQYMMTTRSLALLICAMLSLLAAWARMLSPIVLVMAAVAGMLANFMTLRAQASSKLPMANKVV